MNKLKGENLATGVIALEWLMIVVQTIGAIFYLKYLGDNPQFATAVDLNPSTALILSSFGAIASIIFSIFLAILLTRGIIQKSSRYLSIWIIIQYVLFVITFVAVVANVVGYINVRWSWITLIISLIYRFFILKVISEFNQEIGHERDKERRRSVADLRGSEAGSTISASPTPAKLTQNNLHFHNSQYVPVPRVPPVIPQKPRHYIPPEYNTGLPHQPIYATPTQSYATPTQPEYVPVPHQPLSTISLSKQYHPQVLPPFRPGHITRSFSESTV